MGFPDNDFTDFDKRMEEMRRTAKRDQVIFLSCAISIFVFFICLIFGCAVYHRRKNHQMFLRSQQQADAETVIQYHPPPRTNEFSNQLPPPYQPETLIQEYPGWNSDVFNTNPSLSPQLNYLPDNPPPYEYPK